MLQFLTFTQFMTFGDTSVVFLHNSEIAFITALFGEFQNKFSY